MKGRLYTFLVKILSHLPQMIARLPYTLCLFLIRHSRFQVPVTVYPRNSYVSKNIVMGLSDLDISFIVHDEKFERPLFVREGENILKKYRWWKLLFPFLGEINIISNSRLPLFISFINYYELQRDPFLAMKFPNEKPERLEKAFFIFKMLVSDIENLQKRFSVRKKKWTTHLGQSIPSKSLDEFLPFLKKCLDLRELNLDIERFFKTFNSYKSREPQQLYDIFFKEGLEREFMTFYFSLWIGETFTRERFEQIKLRLKDFKSDEKNFLKLNVHWEIWGLFCQYSQVEDQKKLYVHLENLKQLSSFLFGQGSEEVKAIDELVELNLELI